jgi:hemolysin activation/secretion protein
MRWSKGDRGMPGARRDVRAPGFAVLERAACGGVLGLIAAATPFASCAAAPLSSNDPSQVAKVPPQPAPPSPPLALPKVRAAPAPQETEPRFVLRHVAFDGETELPEARLRPAWTEYAGKPVSLTDLREIGRRAEAIYTTAGYPFVAIVLKVQQVKDGDVHFDVVEGRITDLSVLGANLTARRQATAMLDPLVNRPQLSLDDVETAYELARSVPGLSVSGTLRPGSEPGGMDLVVAAQRTPDLRTYVNVNNLYADAVGPWGFLLGADYDGGSEFGDRLSAQVYASVPLDRQVLFHGSYARTLNAQGTTVTLSGLWGNANPQEAAGLTLATDIAVVQLDVSQPLIDRPQGSLVVDAAFQASDQLTKLPGAAELSDDELRIFSASLTGETTGSAGRLSGSLELRQGADILGASKRGDPDLSHADANPEATVFKASFEAQSVTVDHMSLAVRTDMQWAGSPLTSPDQYAFGNLTIGRGYQPGLALSDSVIAGSAELRIGPFHVAKQLQAQPFAFVDAGRLYSRGLPTYDLSSAGGGFRFQVAGKFEMDLVCADPLQAPPGGARPGPTVLLNVTVGLDDLFASIHRRLVTETGK